MCCATAVEKRGVLTLLSNFLLLHCRRIVTNRRAKSGYEKPTTVFVNPNCDDYKLALHETSKYADIFY